MAAVRVPGCTWTARSGVPWSTFSATESVCAWPGASASRRSLLIYTAFGKSPKTNIVALLLSEMTADMLADRIINSYVDK